MGNKDRIQEIEREIFERMNRFFITGQIDYERVGELSLEKCRLKSRTPPAHLTMAD